MRRSLCSFVRVGLVFGNLWFASAESFSAAALYKNGNSPGLRISIELKRNGTVSVVSPQADFRNGDQIRLHFVSNVDGYVYAMNETPSGETKLLFPGPDTGSNNMVRKDQDYTIPSTNGWFRMTGTPGVEKVTMIISPRALPEMQAGVFKSDSSPAAASRPAAQTPPAVDSGGAVNSTAHAAPMTAAAATQSDSGGAANSTGKPNVKNKGKSQSPLATANQDLNQVRSGVSMVNGVASIPASVARIPGISRDLVFEDDVKHGATYVSSKPDGSGSPTIFTIALVHR
jgi:Domain of unknown function (DUF4384)